MAVVDYFGIEQAIKTQLEADADLSAVANFSAQIEPELEFSRSPLATIHLDRRVAPDDRQTIAAGRRTRYLLTIEIWVFEFALTHPEAAEKRDDLLGKVEIALMRDRKFGGAVTYSWLSGGRFLNALNDADQSFMLGASVELTVDVSAVT